ncbi:MAG: 2TM domain-containing protein [Lewinellaceae bacterium]|nr:2TM domain-containing protein [Lewinellaceae bacterium]
MFLIVGEAFIQNLVSMSDYEYQAARSRVREKKRFYRRLGIFVALSVFFLLLNVLTSFGSWWFMWPILGMGLGIAIKYFKIFGFPGVGSIDEDWEDREMEKEMRRLGSGQPEEDGLELPELEKPKRKNWDEDELV